MDVGRKRAKRPGYAKKGQSLHESPKGMPVSNDLTKVIRMVVFFFKFVLCGKNYAKWFTCINS